MHRKAHGLVVGDYVTGIGHMEMIWPTGWACSFSRVVTSG